DARAHLSIDLYPEVGEAVMGVRFSQGDSTLSTVLNFLVGRNSDPPPCVNYARFSWWPHSNIAFGGPEFEGFCVPFGSSSTPYAASGDWSLAWSWYGVHNLAASATMSITASPPVAEPVEYTAR